MIAGIKPSYFSERMTIYHYLLLAKKHGCFVLQYLYFTALKSNAIPLVLHKFAVGNNGYPVLFPQTDEECRMTRFAVEHQCALRRLWRIIRVNIFYGTRFNEFGYDGIFNNDL